MHIEEFIVGPERARLLQDWSREYSCWQGTRENTDHLDDESCRTLYFEMSGHCDPYYCLGATCSKQHLGADIAPAIYKPCVNELTAEDYGHTFASSMIGEDHGRRYFLWKEKLARDLSKPKAFFTHQADLVLRDFGLCMLTWNTASFPVGDDGDVDRRAVAFLTLPGNEFSAESTSGSGEWGDDDFETDFFCEAQMGLPDPLSLVNVATFKRAYLILGLGKVDSSASDVSSPKASGHDGVEDGLLEQPTSTAGAQPDPWIPKLRLLIGGHLH